MYNLKHGLTTKDIVNALRLKRSFGGCFPSDKIPRFYQFPCTIVVNTQTADKPGQHWVAIHITKYASFYFDSFGLPALEPHILRYLKSYSRRVVYNPSCIQHMFSTSCGLFCIAFVKHVYSKKSFISFISRFSNTNLVENDSIVLQLI